MRLTATTVLTLILFTAARADPRQVTGTYRNPALGYSVKVPDGLIGKTGDQAGPERGFGLSLRSGGVISVYGEPNSLEWDNAKDGVKWALDDEKCEGERRTEIGPARVGKIRGAKGLLSCNEEVSEFLLAFRPGRGPIYWLTLRTNREHESEDDFILKGLAATFKLIRWQ